MIPEKAQQYIGKISAPRVFEVEKGAIRRYAEAVGDDNPLYRDEEYARKTRYGGIIASPGFFGWPVGTVSEGGADAGSVVKAFSEAGFPRLLDAGMSYEFYQPVHTGDTLVASSMIKEITEKESKSGVMFIYVVETTYLNQNGELVARSYHSTIAR